MIGIGAQAGNQVRLAFDQIPFVDREHERPPLALDEIGDAQVLLLEPVLRVHHQHDDFGKAHRAQGVGHRELFELLLDARAAAQARGIEHAELASLPVNLHRNGIAGGARLGAGQQPLLAEQLVDQRRLAGVGPADDGDANGPRCGFLFGDVLVGGLFLVLDGRRHQRGQRVVELAHALAVLGGNLHGIAQAQRVGFHCADLAVLALGLVGDQHHRLVGAAGEIGEGAVVRRQPHARVDHEHQGIGLRDRGLGLLLHPRRQRAFGALIEPGGIDDGEGEIVEPGLAFPTIAGDAGKIVDQRKLLSNQAVEQRRPADIGPADDGDRERHETVSSAGFAAPVNATGMN